MRSRVLLLALLIACWAWPASSLAGQATLTWQDMSVNELGFHVERKGEACLAGGGAWARIASPGVNATGYVDTTVQPGATYAYRVQAWNRQYTDGTGAEQVSAYSNCADITMAAAPTVPGPPTNVAVVQGSEQCSTAACSWEITWREPATSNLLRTTLYTMVSGTTVVQKVDVPATAATGGGTVTARSVPMPIVVGSPVTVEVWVAATNSQGEGEAQGIAPITVTVPFGVPAVPSQLGVQQGP